MCMVVVSSWDSRSSCFRSGGKGHAVSEAADDVVDGLVKEIRKNRYRLGRCLDITPPRPGQPSAAKFGRGLHPTQDFPHPIPQEGICPG